MLADDSEEEREQTSQTEENIVNTEYQANPVCNQKESGEKKYVVSEVIISNLDEEVKHYVEQDDERLSTKTEEKIRGLEHTNEIHLFRL